MASLLNLLPINFKNFEAIDVKDTDDSGGCASWKIHCNSLVHSANNQLEQALIQCLMYLI